MASTKIQVEETNLEDLILLGDDKKIPIIIEYPKPDGTRVKAKALIKQLTLKELDGLKIQQTNLMQTNIELLMIGFFKSNGESWTEEELRALPIGVINKVATQILEISGVDQDKTNELVNF